MCEIVVRSTNERSIGTRAGIRRRTPKQRSLYAPALRTNGTRTTNRISVRWPQRFWPHSAHRRRHCVMIYGRRMLWIPDCSFQVYFPLVGLQWNHAYRIETVREKNNLSASLTSINLKFYYDFIDRRDSVDAHGILHNRENSRTENAKENIANVTGSDS